MEEFRDGNKTWHIKRDPNGEKEINLFVVVEFFRLIFYLGFLFIIALGVALTLGFCDCDYAKTLREVFGVINVCVFFDHPPSTYVLPSVYVLLVVIGYKYTIMAIFRAWVAKEEEKISGVSFVFYLCAFIYYFISLVIFSTIFAVPPTDKTTIFVHTLPYTNIIIALTVVQIAVTWFGVNVAWIELNTSKFVRFGNYLCVTGLVLTSTFKLFGHVNILGDVIDETWEGIIGITGKNQTEETGNDRGLWWNIHDDTMMLIGEISDKIWLFCAILFPIVQSGYLVWKKFDTHGVVITIRDNRKAKKENSDEKENLPLLTK